jgi:predicted dehydrogenase
VNPALNYTGIKGRKSGPQGPQDFGLPPVDHFAAEMDAFSDCILNNRPTTVPGEEGRRDQRIMAAIYESAETGREVPIE